MAVSSCHCTKLLAAFECRSDPSGTEQPSHGRYSARVKSVRQGTASFLGGGISSLIFKFPPNFVRQLSTKARRNCGNIGVAQVVAASWSNNSAAGIPSAAASNAASAAATAATAAIPAAVPAELVASEKVAVVEELNQNATVQLEDLTYAPFLSSDGSIAVHAGTKSNQISFCF